MILREATASLTYIAYVALPQMFNVRERKVHYFIDFCKTLKTGSYLAISLKWLNVNVFMYVCMCVCMYVSMYVCMYVCVYVCMYVCKYVCMYVCLCMYVFMYVCM